MKRILSAFLIICLLLSSFFVSGAVEDSDTVNELLLKYSTFEIVNMYPEFSSYLAKELRALNNDISVEAYKVNVKIIDAVFFSVVCENPDLFYVDAHYFETTSELASGTLISIRPYYLFDIEDIPEKISELDNAADYIIAQINEDLDDFYKCRYVHDLIGQYVHYDMDIYNTNPNIRTAYGALIEHNAVCEGYTLAYNYILSKLNIESHFLESLKMKHTWAYVKLGGKYYHVDVTYDDPSYDTLGRVKHLYCLVSDSALKADGVHHDWICNTKADDKSLDKIWWRNINTVIYPYNGYDYYINQSYSSSVYGAFIRRNTATGHEHIIERIYTRWNVEGKGDGAFWETAYCYLTFDGNYFYYNDTEGVYRHKPDNSSYFDVLYKKSKTEPHNVFGIAIQMDGKLYISIKESPNVADVIYFLDKNVLNQNTEQPAPITENLYSPSENGATLYKYVDQSENIVLPSSIEGNNITALGENIFLDRLELNSVIVPDGIESIGDSAFYNCPNLKNVVLPETLTSIGDAAFNGCTSLKEIIIPKNVNKIGKNVFSGCVNLTIKGYKNSTAETYAALYKIHFEPIDTPNPADSSKTVKTKKATVKSKLTIYVKQKATLEPGSGSGYKYSSNKKSIAVISKKGVVTAKKKGKAVIKIENKKIIFKIKVTVKNPKLNKSKLSLKRNQSFKLKIKGQYGSASFKSSNSKVASVSYNGKIKAKRQGAAVITVKTNGKIKLKCKVVVF